MVCEGLYIGDAEAAKEWEMIEELGIERIISLGNENELKKYKYFENIEYLKIIIEDDDNENIQQYFEMCNNFIALGNVLVHCHKGISRSATIVIAYLMYTHQMDFTEAFEKLKTVRSFIEPNKGFIRQLQESLEYII